MLGAKQKVEFQGEEGPEDSVVCEVHEDGSVDLLTIVKNEMHTNVVQGDGKGQWKEYPKKELKEEPEKEV